LSKKGKSNGKGNSKGKCAAKEEADPCGMIARKAKANS
jgi:hypothetical protein